MELSGCWPTRNALQVESKAWGPERGSSGFDVASVRSELAGSLRMVIAVCPAHCYRRDNLFLRCCYQVEKTIASKLIEVLAAHASETVAYHTGRSPSALLP